MWKLLELHSRMCNEPDSCKVPLCRMLQNQTDSRFRGLNRCSKWKLLINKVIAAKNGSYICSALYDIYIYGITMYF
ncbi:hypothetical protein ES332_D02G008700v1 [Gossypium tomentosum]|uniref:TAZ-type domain-containing protein n=1 Tax=Gossypium tomentosum TaxID=34277 RepID=A0A5D2LSF0_GOSTO|nr:hypothetical protein ES332_D02G008700v1 [Gossypium tomentosum]